MPHLETPAELADHLADQVGVYGAHEDETCTEQRPCRPCYVTDLTERIRAAVQNETMLVAMEQMPAPPPPKVRVRVWPVVEQLPLLSPTAEELEQQRAKVRARYKKGGCTCDLSLTGLHHDDCPAAVQVT
jgi:hypothetical protein